MKTWFRLPLAVRAVIYVAVGFGFAFLAFLVTDLDRLYHGNTGSRMVGWLVLAACIGLMVGPFALGVEAGLRRDFDSIEHFIVYKRALRTSELPARIEPDVWRGWLRRSLGINRLAQLLGYLLVVFVVLPGLTSRSAYHWAAVSLCALLATCILVTSRQTRARITRLETEVKRRATPAVTPEEAQAAVTPEETWFRWPLAVRVFMIAAVWFTYAFLVLLVGDLDSVIYSGSRIVHLEWAAFWAALMGLAIAAVTFGAQRGLRRDFGSVEQFSAYHQALRTGELPARIEPDVWRGWLGGSRRQNRIGPLWACFLVVVGMWSVTHPSGYHWVTAWLFELLAIWYLVRWWGTRVRLARLGAEVERPATLDRRV